MLNKLKTSFVASIILLSATLKLSAVEVAKPGESINMLGDHKCFSWTEQLITYVNKLGWTNATSIKDVQKCDMGAIRLLNGQSMWIDDMSIINVSPMSGGAMLCFDTELKQKWRSKYVGYCTPYGS